MWKQSIKFQTRILKQEESQIFPTSNIHKIPELIKILFLSKISLSISKKPILSYLCVVQLALRRKGYVLLTKKSNTALKIQKGLPIGARIVLSKRKSLLFLYFLVFNLFPQLDWVKLLKVKNVKQNFNFNINSTEIIKDLAALSTYFTANLKMEVSLLNCQQKQKGKVLWRLLKIPVK